MFLSYLCWIALSASSDRTRRPAVRGSPRPLGLLGRVGRDSARAVAPERLAGGRVRPIFCGSPNSASDFLTCTSTTKKTRFSRSEGSSGRTYECMDGSRGGTALRLLSLLVKVKAHSLSADGARPRKASNATRGALEKLQTQLGGPTPSDKNGGLLLHSEQHSMHQRAAARRPWV